MLFTSFRRKPETPLLEKDLETPFLKEFDYTCNNPDLKKKTDFIYYEMSVTSSESDCEFNQS